VLADPAGDLVLTGAMRDVTDARTGFAVAKIAASDGSELWRIVLDGAANPDGARGVALAHRTDAVVVAGWTGPTVARKLTVVTLDPATGASVGSVPPSCTSGIAITSAALAVKRSGNGQTADANITANLPFPTGRPARFDPTRQGLQVRVEDVGSGLAAVFDASDASQPVPLGAVGEGCDPRRDGWTAKQGVFRYQNVSRAVGVRGCTPGSARGLRTVVLRARRAQGRGIDLRLVSKGAPPFGTLVGPLP